MAVVVGEGGGPARMQAASNHAVAPPSAVHAELTSVRFLQLKDAFRRMAVVGIDCIDEELVSKMLLNAGREFEAVCAEVGAEQQLEELEALCLRRGLSLDAERLGDPAAAPAAVEAAARYAAKQAERQQLQEMLAKLRQRRAALDEEVAVQRRAVEQAREAYMGVENMLAEVHAATKSWLAAPGER